MLYEKPKPNQEDFLNAMHLMTTWPIAVMYAHNSTVTLMCAFFCSLCLLLPPSLSLLSPFLPLP